MFDGVRGWRQGRAQCGLRKEDGKEESAHGRDENVHGLLSLLM